MKVQIFALLTFVVSTSLSARTSDRGGRLLDAAIQERPRGDKPNGSFAIQLNGGHIRRVDFGFQESQQNKPGRAQSRSDDRHISSSSSHRQPAVTHQSTATRSGLFTNVDSNRSIINSQHTSKRPFITHKALSNGGQPRSQKQSGFNDSTFKFNSPETHSRRDHRSSSSSIPSHFTIQQRRPENSKNNANSPRVVRPIPRVTPHSHFNPPVVERPTLRERPHNHFNLPVVERPVQREKPKPRFNPPVVDRQAKLNRPASAHFRPATFHFGAPPSLKSSPRRPESSQRISNSKPTTRRPETSHRSSSKPSTRTPFISHRPRTTPRPNNISRNKSASRSQTSSNNNTNRPKPASISAHLIPKGVKPSKFVPPSSGKGSIDEFGPSGNSIQTPVLSPNLPKSIKDIPTIYYPIRPKIFPSKRVQM